MFASPSTGNESWYAGCLLLVWRLGKDLILVPAILTVQDGLLQNMGNVVLVQGSPLDEANPGSTRELSLSVEKIAAKTVRCFVSI